MQNLSNFYSKVLELSVEERGYVLVDVVRNESIYGIKLDNSLRARFVEHLLLLGADPESRSMPKPLFLPGDQWRSPRIAKEQSLPSEAMRVACEKGYTDVVNVLLKFGANPNGISRSTLGSRQYAPIYIAAENGYIDIVKVLIEFGADVHVWEDDSMVTAAEKGYFEIVKILINAGANPCAQENVAIYWAARNGHIDVVELLLDYVKDKKDFELIRIATENGHNEIVKLFLKHSWTTDKKELDDLVFLASTNNHFDVIKTLLENGTDLYSSGGILLQYYKSNPSKYAFLESYFDQPTKKLIEIGASENTILYFGPFYKNAIISDEEAIRIKAEDDL